MGRRRGSGGVRATPDEVARALPGDGVVPRAEVVMDRGLDLPAPPEEVWPWLVQLGKRRAGWYLPRHVERLVPPDRRATRRVEARWQQLAVGDVVPDYGGASASFEVLSLERPHHVVFGSRRGHVDLTWAIVLHPAPAGTRVQLRLRLGGVRRPWLATSLGEWFDAVTVAGMAAGLRERLEQSRAER